MCFRLLPNKETIIPFQKTFGCAVLFTIIFSLTINLYKYTNKSMNYNEISIVLTNYGKKEFLF